MSEMVLLLPFVMRGLITELGTKGQLFEQLLIEYIVLKNNLFYREYYSDKIIGELDKLRISVQQQMLDISNRKDSNYRICY
jgi:hypothetical protein